MLKKESRNEDRHTDGWMVTQMLTGRHMDRHSGGIT